MPKQMCLTDTLPVLVIGTAALPLLSLLLLICDVTVTESDVLRAISKMKVSASSHSSGPNGLPPVLFTRLKHSLVTPLTLMYNQLLSVAEVPADWKKAVIMPVYKKKVTLQIIVPSRSQVY